MRKSSNRLPFLLILPLALLGVLTATSACSGTGDSGIGGDPTEENGGGEPGGGGSEGGGGGGGDGADGGTDTGSGDAGTGADGGDLGDGGQGTGGGGAVGCTWGGEETAQATFYSSMGGAGACAIPLTFDNYAAGAPAVFSGGTACGACAEVSGPDGTTRVILADRCPECTGQHLDLSPSAFDAIADPNAGIVPITWRFVPCPTAGNVELIVEPGSNDFYLSLLVWNHRHPLATVELQQAGQSGFTAMVRQEHSAFTLTSGGSPFAYPVTLRITSVHGHEIIETLANGSPGTHAGANQFQEACP